MEKQHTLEELVDALCLASTGWRTPEEQKLYLAGDNTVYRRVVEIRQADEIKRLKARIAELEEAAARQSL